MYGIILKTTNKTLLIITILFFLKISEFFHKKYTNGKNLLNFVIIMNPYLEKSRKKLLFK